MKKLLQSPGVLAATLPEYGLRERALRLPERSSMNVVGGTDSVALKKSPRRIE
jgi:hypothetical protein